MTQTTLKQPTNLERVIKDALDQNINRTCDCERDISYEEYADPVGAIAKAISDYIYGQFVAWEEERIKIMRAHPSAIFEVSIAIEDRIAILKWAEKNLKLILGK